LGQQNGRWYRTSVAATFAALNKYGVNAPLKNFFGMTLRSD
jgi:hypothetical protein